jgi:hypothetical protein
MGVGGNLFAFACKILKRMDMKDLLGLMPKPCW